MANDLIREDRGDGITLLRIARPEARNALTTDMARRLTALLGAIDADTTCRVVVLTGDGAGFCAGLDLKAAMSGDDAPQGAADWMALQDVFGGLMAKLRAIRQPVVAAVRGAAVGAGCGLALASDVRIAAADARFLVGAVKVGLSAGECGISYHLPRIIGAGRAFEIMLTGRAVDAAEAVQIGLVSAVVDADALLDRAMETARMIAANSPYSVKHTKQVMWANLDAPSLAAALELENHVQVVGLLTQDFAEAASAFAEKRPPQFTGR